MAAWPRLSQSLPHPRGVGFCQACGEKDARVWQEHDDADKPHPIAVYLCGNCSDRLIEPRSRL